MSKPGRDPGKEGGFVSSVPGTLFYCFPLFIFFAYARFLGVAAPNCMVFACGRSSPV